MLTAFSYNSRKSQKHLVFKTAILTLGVWKNKILNLGTQQLPLEVNSIGWRLLNQWLWNCGMQLNNQKGLWKKTIAGLHLEFLIHYVWGKQVYIPKKF